MTRKGTIETSAIVVYWRLRYAAAPSWTARAISRMRSFPSGRCSSQTVRPTPYATANAPQMSANSTGWSLKKLPTISVLTPSQGQRRVTPARAGFYHMGALSGRRVNQGGSRELERRKGGAPCHAVRDDCDLA